MVLQTPWRPWRSARWPRTAAGAAWRPQVRARGAGTEARKRRVSLGFGFLEAAPITRRCLQRWQRSPGVPGRCACTHVQCRLGKPGSGLGRRRTMKQHTLAVHEWRRRAGRKLPEDSRVGCGCKCRLGFQDSPCQPQRYGAWVAAPEGRQSLVGSKRQLWLAWGC